MSSHISTKQRLLTLIDDIECISKELVEQATLAKHQKMTKIEHSTLVDLLVAKDAEFRKVLLLAEEQAKVEESMDRVREKVDVLEGSIKKMQKTLKDAESVLSTAIFHANHKLASIGRANSRPVAIEELIKYAHRISSADAVSAPLTWTIGDLRRPYPTDLQMRNGFLGKSELNMNGTSTVNPTSVPQDIQRPMGDVPNTFQNQFNWNMGELHMSLGNSGNSVPLETRAKKESASQDDVEVMSSDSSSSSSSDSQ